MHTAPFSSQFSRATTDTMQGIELALRFYTSFLNVAVRAWLDLYLDYITSSSTLGPSTHEILHRRICRPGAPG